MTDLENGRRRMLRDIEDEVALTRSLTGRDRLDPRVMAALAEVPRESFVPPDLRHAAFANGPLPIGHGQTISQPYIVALMTDLLGPRPDHRVLEIGTGSGYQTAILGRLADQVYSVELVPELSEAAARLLQGLGYDNIRLRVGNGYAGWPEQAPFDGILVTAAAPRVPPALVEQLRPGGRLVIPVGEPHAPQELLLIEKGEDGGHRVTPVLGVAFVPMVDEEPAAER